MLLAATLVIVLPQLLQNRNSALIVQVGAAGAAEQQAELSLAGRGWYQETFVRERVLPALIPQKALPTINKPHFELDGVGAPAGG